MGGDTEDESRRSVLFDCIRESNEMGKIERGNELD